MMKTVAFILLFYCSNVFAESAGVKPVVSVIINADNSKHAFETLNAVVNLSKKVKVTNIVMAVKKDRLYDFAPVLTSIYGEMPEKFLKKPRQEMLSQSYEKYFDSLNLYGSTIKFDPVLISRLSLTYSPTWVVRYRGKDYIFEGYGDISKYFTRDGSFNY